MNASIDNYIINQKLKDDRFNVEELQRYNLSLQLGNHDFRVAVTDNYTHRCLVLEDYTFIQSEGIINTLQALYEEHHFLKAGFWNTVKIAFKNSLFSFVPTPLFSKVNMDAYLNVNVSLKDESVFYYKHDKPKSVNVFGANPRSISFFTAAYPGINLHFLHQTSVLIEGLRQYEDFSHQKHMSLLVEKNAINILVYQGDFLLYCNRFTFSLPTQMMQYVMAVMHELQLDQYGTKVIAWGDLKADSQIFEILQTYIYNISFGGKLPLLSYGYVFDEIEDHNYFDLFSIHLCD